MFEIGSSLREARERQGRTFADLEHKTMIRTRYLKALEDEEFDVLPAPAYVRGFLIVYADELGLEGQLYVDEFNSRFSALEEAGAPFRRRETRAKTPARTRRIASGAVAAALATIVVMLALIFAAFTSDPEGQNVPNLSGGKTSTEAVAVKLTAARGNTFAEVHAGNEDGEQLFGGTLLRGRSKTFQTPVWVTVDAVQNMSWTIAGDRAAAPADRVGPATMLFTSEGQKFLSR